MSHRYHVGQILEVRAAPRTSNRRAGPCEVLFCLPQERGPVLYRVKSLSESVERIGDEIDLTPSSTTKPAAEATAISFTIAVSRR